MTDQHEQVAKAQTDDSRTAEELVEAYRRGPGLIRDAITGLDADALRARPIEGKMSSLEVLCHVGDCEQFLADRMKRTIGTGRPLLVGVDATPYLTRLHYHGRDPQLQLALIDITRRQLAADLDRIEPDDWLRQAVHTEIGLVTVRQQILHAIRHLEFHVGTIREKRAALGV